jgi:ribosomal protein S1
MLDKAGVKSYTNSKVISIDSESVYVQKADGTTELIKAEEFTNYMKATVPMGAASVLRTSEAPSGAMSST